MVLHTNPPLHELFGFYGRCFFSLPLADGSAVDLRWLRKHHGA